MYNPTSLSDALKALRVDAGLSIETVAERLSRSEEYVKELESGARRVYVEELTPLAAALGCNVTTILNRIEGLDSILDRWELSEAEFTELVDENPSLRGMVLGYAAEVKFRRMFLDRPDITSTKDDDHNRKKKGDRRLWYKSREILVEVKSLQTKFCNYDDLTNTWSGRTQVDASDRRKITFDDNSTLETTLLLRGEFDILAVNCFAFGGSWRFAFALNSELATSPHRAYTPEQRSRLIASYQDVTWPPRAPFTEDFDEILERAWASSPAEPAVVSIKEE